MLLSLGKDGLTSLFKEVTGFSRLVLPALLQKLVGDFF